MALDVGEVITFFEGAAEGLFETIEEIERRLDELSRRTTEVRVTMPKELFPVGDIVAALGRVEEKLDAFADRIDDLADNAVSSARKVGSQVQEISSSTISNVTKEVNSGVETIAARLGAASALGVSVGFLSTQFGTIADIIKSRIVPEAKGAGTFFTSLITNMHTALNQLFSTTITQSSILMEMLFRASRLLPLMAGGAFFTIIPIMLREVFMLMRRIRGGGLANLTVLEKASQLVTSIADAISLAQTRVKALFLFFGGAIATVWLPFWGQILLLPAIINTFIGGLTNAIRKVTLRGLAALGSGRAMFALMLQNAKEFGATILPQINKLAKRIIAVSKRVAGFGFVEIVNKMMAFGQQGIKMLAQISVQLKTVFGTTKEQTKEIQTEVDKTMVDFDKRLAATNKKMLGFWGNMRAQIRNVRDKINTEVGQSLKDAFKFTIFAPLKRLGQRLFGIRPKAKPGKPEEIVELESAKKAEGAVKRIGKKFAEIRTETKQSREEAKLLGKELEKIIKDLLKVPKKPIKGAIFSERTAGNIRAFVESLERFVRGTGKMKSVVKNLDNLNASLRRVGRKQEMSARVLEMITVLKRLQDFLDKGIVKPATRKRIAKEMSALIDPKEAGTAGDRFVARLKKTLNTGLDHLATMRDRFAKTISSLFMPAGRLQRITQFGRDMMRAFAEGIKQGKVVVEKTTEETLKDGMDSQIRPGSPPKRGPLKTITKSGTGLMRELGKGIANGRGLIDKATKTVAERIAGYFPRSPALFGPLVFLPKMGISIVKQLAGGMIKGIGFLKDAVAKVVQLIAEPIAQIADTARLAERTGFAVDQLSALGFAMRSAGADASELGFVLMQINDAMSRGFSDEQLQSLNKFGVSIADIETAADPAMAFLLTMSDVIAGLTPGTEEFRQALELLGLSAHSNFVNVLQMGSDELVRLQQEAVELGATISPELAQASREFQGLRNQLDAVRQTLVNDFLQAILPSLVSAMDSVIAKIKKNRTTIQAVFMLAGQALVTFSKLVVEFFELVIEEPEKAFDVITGTLTALAVFVLGTLSDLWAATKDEFVNFLGATLKFAWDTTITFMTGLFDAILPIVKRGMAEAMLAGVKEITEPFDQLPDELRMAIEIAVPVFGPMLRGFNDIQNNLEQTIAETKEQALDFEGILKDTTKEVEDEFADMAAATGELANELFSEERANEVRARVDQLTADLNQSIADTELEPLFEELGQILSEENFEAVKSNIEAGKDALSDAIESVQDTDVAALVAFVDKEAKATIAEIQKAAEGAIESVKGDIAALPATIQPIFAEMLGVDMRSDLAKQIDAIDQQIAQVQEETLAFIREMKVENGEIFDELFWGAENTDQAVADVYKSMQNVSREAQNTIDGLEQQKRLLELQLELIEKHQGAWQTINSLVGFGLTQTEQLTQEYQRQKAELDALAASVETAGLSPENEAALRAQIEETNKALDEQLRISLWSQESWQAVTDLVDQSKTEVERLTEAYEAQQAQLAQVAEEVQRLFELGILTAAEAEAAFEQVAIAAAESTRAYEEGLAGVTEKAEEVAEEFGESLQLESVTALGNAFEKGLTTFVMKGRFAMQDLADIAQGVFEESFSQITTFLKDQLSSAITSAFEAIGATGEAGQLAFAGILSVASLLLTRIKGEVEVVNKDIQETVQKTEQLRGVIAGEVTVGIQEVSERLIVANTPVVVRLDRVVELLTQIRDRMGPGGTIAPVEVGSLGLVENF